MPLLRQTGRSPTAPATDAAAASFRLGPGEPRNSKRASDAARAKPAPHSSSLRTCLARRMDPHINCVPRPSGAGALCLYGFAQSGHEHFVAICPSPSGNSDTPAASNATLICSSRSYRDRLFSAVSSPSLCGAVPSPSPANARQAASLTRPAARAAAAWMYAPPPGCARARP